MGVASCSSTSSSPITLLQIYLRPGAPFALSDPCSHTAVESMVNLTKPNEVVASRDTGHTMLGFALQVWWEELLPTGHEGLNLARRWVPA